MPICVPRHFPSDLDGIRTHDLLRDRQASTPGCSTRAYSFSSGSGGGRTHSIPGSKPRWSAGCLPSRSAQSGSRTRKHSGLGRAALPCWRIWAKVVPDGIEPSFPGCRPSVVAVGPRDRVSQVESPGVAPGTDAQRWSLQLAELASSCWTMTPMCFMQRKPWDSNPQAALCRHLFSRQAPHPVGWLPFIKLRRLESNRAPPRSGGPKTFRASHPTVR